MTIQLLGRGCQRKLVVAVLLMLSFHWTAFAETSGRCDCSEDSWGSECQARVEPRFGGWAKIISNTQQCSLVAWSISGETTLTVVSDGAELVQIDANRPNPDVSVLSCVVCKDNLNSGRGSPPPSESDLSGPEADVGTLIISMPSGFRGWGLVNTISVDGSEIGKLKNGDSLEVVAPPGIYTVEGSRSFVGMNQGKCKTSIDVVANRVSNLEIRNLEGSGCAFSQ